MLINFSNFKFGADIYSGLLLYFGPFLQCAQPVDYRLIFEATFPLFQEEMKMVFGDAVVSGEMAFRLVPKFLDPIELVTVDRKGICVINTMVIKLRDIKDVV